MSFKAQIDAWTKKSKERMRAVFQQSAQETILIAQEPKARGGRMPVDTGFLRASGLAKINEQVSGSVTSLEWENVTVTIVRAELGDTIKFGWVANYARIAENREGFMRGAAEQWPSTVQKVIEDAKRRFP